MPNGDRLALVVGCGSYDDPTLQALQATLTDVGAIESVLRDENICQFTKCTAITDRSKAEVEREVHRFLKSAPFDSLVLLYFTGHGIKDEQGSLYFAQKDTESDLLESTAVSADFIRRQMDACVSDRKVLLLDCCFAGAFPKGAKSGGATVDIEHQFSGEIRKGRGFFVISATGEFQYAYSSGLQLEAIADKPEPSIFTRHLVHGLRTGEADTDNNGLIKVNELFDYIQRRVAAERPGQTPKMVADVEEDFVLARVPPQRGADIRLPLEIEPAEAKVGTSVDYSLPSGESVKVEVQPGSAEGTEIVLAGLGQPGGHGGEPGDAVLSLCFPKREAVAGANLFARVSVSADEADAGVVTVVRYSGGDLSLEIPPETADGDTIEVAGKGLPGQHGGQAGRLIVTVDVAAGQPAKGKDFAHELALTPEEASAGCVKHIETPADKNFALSVPPGTPNGFEFPPKLGLGYPGRYGGQTGDLRVTVKIEYPRPEDHEYVLELTADEAREGVVKVISGSWGRFEHAVPKNCVSGRTVRIKGMGATGAYGQAPGDLLVTYLVKEPEPEATTAAAQPIEKPPSADPRVVELEGARRKIEEIEKAARSGEASPFVVALVCIFVYPFLLYLIRLVLESVLRQEFIPKEVYTFLFPKIPFLYWLFSIACVVGGIVMIFVAIGQSMTLAKCRSQVQRLEKAIQSEPLPK